MKKSSKIKIPNNKSKLLYDNIKSSERPEISIMPKIKESFAEQQIKRFNNSINFSIWFNDLKKLIYENDKYILENIKIFEELILNNFEKGLSVEDTLNTILNKKGLK